MLLHKPFPLRIGSLPSYHLLSSDFGDCVLDICSTKPIVLCGKHRRRSGPVLVDGTA